LCTNVFAKCVDKSKKYKKKKKKKKKNNNNNISTVKKNGTNGRANRLMD
jgi:hypothetical protein